MGSVIGLLLFMIPGAALWVAVRAWEPGAAFDPTAMLADVFGLSLAAAAAAGVLSFYFQLHLNAFWIALLLLAAAAWAVYRLRRAGGERLVQVLRASAGGSGMRSGASPARFLPLLALSAILAFRFYQARTLVVPAWVDSVHHTLLTRLILETGGVPASFEPYMPVPLLYHAGFHTASALFAFLSGLEPVRTVLVFGQVLNAAAALGAYRLAHAIWGGWRRGLAAMLLVGFAFQMPAYYLTWGRYTLLTGIFIFAVAAAMVLEGARGEGGAGRRLPLAVLTAGLIFSHYLAAILFALFLGAVALVGVVRSAARGQGGPGEAWSDPAPENDAAETHSDLPGVNGGGEDRAGVKGDGADRADEKGEGVDQAGVKGDGMDQADEKGEGASLAALPTQAALEGGSREIKPGDAVDGEPGRLVQGLAYFRSDSFLGFTPSVLLGGFFTLPWILRVLAGSLGVIGVQVVLPGQPLDAAYFSGYLEYIGYLLGPMRSHILHGVGLAGLLLLGWRREALPFALFTAAAALLHLPWGLSLRPFRPDHGVILAFLPAALFIADGLVTLVEWFPGALGRRLTAVLAAAAVVFVCAWGIRDTADLLHPDTVFTGADDLEAIRWIEEHTAEEAVFLINTTHWQGSAYRGVDGGWWITPLTGRKTTLPPVLYLDGTPAYVRALLDQAERMSQIAACDAGFWEMAAETGATHVYLHQGRGNLQPLALGGCEGVTPVYGVGDVFIFALDE